MLLNEIYNEDCKLTMERIESGTVDLILQDPPYNITGCDWEYELDLTDLWKEWKRILKPNGAVVMTAAQPFTSALVMSNVKMFKYDWVWNKKKATGHLNVQKQPLRLKEDILVFYDNQPTYNPQFGIGNPYKGNGRQAKDTEVYGLIGEHRNDNEGIRYPKNIIEFSFEMFTVHPTQKQIDLFRYLIKTYTNEGDLVFDGYMGSGTTALACIEDKRNYIGSELNSEYFEIINRRIKNALLKPLYFKNKKLNLKMCGGIFLLLITVTGLFCWFLSRKNKIKNQ